MIISQEDHAERCLERSFFRLSPNGNSKKMMHIIHDAVIGVCRKVFASFKQRLFFTNINKGRGLATYHRGYK